MSGGKQSRRIVDFCGGSAHASGRGSPLQNTDATRRIILRGLLIEIQNLQLHFVFLIHERKYECNSVTRRSEKYSTLGRPTPENARLAFLLSSASWGSASSHTEHMNFCNPLRAKFFRGSINMYLYFYVIPPHWHDADSWNPLTCKTRTCLFCIVNIIGADVLATQGARASATVIFTMLNRIDSVSAR